MTEQVIANEGNNRFHCKRKNGRNPFIGTEKSYCVSRVKTITRSSWL